MTGYTVHTGSTIKFSSSWDRIFSETAAEKAETVETKASKGTAKKPRKKSAKTKSAAKLNDAPEKPKKIVAKKLSSKRTGK